MKDFHNLYHRILSEGGTPSTLFLFLSELKQAGDPEAVIRGCAQALCLFPGDIRLRHLMAEACLETGRISLAEAEIERATGEIAGLIPAYRLKAEIHLRGGRPDDARTALEIYLAHKPEDSEARALLEKLAHVSTSPAPEPLPEPVADSELLFETLVEPGPVPEFKEAAQSFPDEPQGPDIATPTLAEVYLGQGQIQEAIATYEKFLALNPRAERSRERLEELRAMIPPPPPAKWETRQDPVRAKKEKTIAALEAWRARLREAS